MIRVPALKPKQVIRVLERAGFCFTRQKGSHRLYIKDKIGVIVPYHNKDLKRKTLHHIIKQSGLSTEEFLDLL